MTTIAELAETRALVDQALRERRPLRLYYHGRRRTLSPHALGVKNRRLMLLGYQSDPDTTSAPPPARREQGWRNLFIDEIEQVGFADAGTVWQSADNYNPTHPFNSIDLLIAAVPSARGARQQS